MKEQDVILVDVNDLPLGLIPKMEAHKKGLLHRAFSIFIINKKSELMLQQRALDKYHSPGLWTNTCCSHPMKDESIISAGHRRLKEEMGFKTDLTKTFHFIYKTPFENGLIEHELDHVLLGNYEKDPIINKNEVADWKWMSLEKVKIDIGLNPSFYTVWFKIIFDQFSKKLNFSHESDS
tara:strand:+ start:96 stop:632 length:537 start_codon:yes stop_codon:yes gene_type:complete